MLENIFFVSVKNFEVTLPFELKEFNEMFLKKVNSHPYYSGSIVDGKMTVTKTLKDNKAAGYSFEGVAIEHGEKTRVTGRIIKTKRKRITTISVFFGVPTLLYAYRAMQGDEINLKMLSSAGFLMFVMLLYIFLSNRGFEKVNHVNVYKYFFTHIDIK